MVTEICVNRRFTKDAVRQISANYRIYAVP